MLVIEVNMYNYIWLWLSICKLGRQLSEEVVYSVNGIFLNVYQDCSLYLCIKYVG